MATRGDPALIRLSRQISETQAFDILQKTGGIQEMAPHCPHLAVAVMERVVDGATLPTSRIAKIAAPVSGSGAMPIAPDASTIGSRLLGEAPLRGLLSIRNRANTPDSFI
jgi:hypothetical protein